MSKRSNQTLSCWQIDVTPVVEFPSLREALTVDVAIVGAGMAGLSIAYQLTQMGLNVGVFEKERIGAGETGRTTAHLSNAIDDRYVEIERLHGLKGAQLAAQSHSAAINEIEAIIQQHGIACDFSRVDGHLFLAPETPRDLLLKELEAAHRAGLWNVVRLEQTPLPNYNFGPCLQFPRQAQFHPLKYLFALAEIVQRQGGFIFEKTNVTGFSGGGNAFLETDHGIRVGAGSVVFATNTPINSRVAMHTKQFPFRTYAIAGHVPVGSLPRGLFWDTAEPYHYIRTQPIKDSVTELLIIGGEDHRTGQEAHPQRRFDKLKSWAALRFPMLKDVDTWWSGQVLEPVDGLAYIGLSPGEENIYIATGDSGMGITHGAIAGLLLADLITSHDNPWADLYDPGRVSIRAAGEFTRDVGNMAAQYADWLTPGDIEQPDELQPGEGGTMRVGLTKRAVYRDQDGVVHQFTAVCPHLGGIVSWNRAENTWDCPCHGSRFTAFGEVLNGPAKSPLESIERVQEKG